MASVAKRKWNAPDGTVKEAWQVRYVDADGRRRGKAFALKKDADAFRQKTEREIHAGIHIVRHDSVSFTDAEIAYGEALARREREGTIRPATLRKEMSHLRIHVRPRFGSKRVVDLNEHDADGFLSDLRARRLSVESIAAIYATLGRLLDFAIRRKWVARNVAREVRAWPENRLPAPTKIRTFDTNEARAIFDYFRDPVARNPMWRKRQAAMGRAIVYLGMFAGMRSGEIRGLPWAAIDFDAGTIAIRQQMDDRRLIAPPKTASSARLIPVPRIILDELEAWRIWSTPNPDGLLFTTKMGRGLSATDLHNHIWKRALIDLGYSADDAGGWPHFHALRHFAGSVMIQHMPPADVSPILGHKNVGITLSVYAGALMSVQSRRPAIENMAAAMGAGTHAVKICDA